MTHRELLQNYLDAWNRRDVSAVLDLLHPGAAFYDAFWMESCVGRHLEKYSKDSLSEDSYTYELIDEPQEIENGIVYRYAAIARDGEFAGQRRYEGFEVLTIRDDKIMTMSDYYADPDPVAMREVARLTAQRHGLPNYVGVGSCAFKYARVKNRLYEAMADNTILNDGSTTIADLAQRLGCTVEQLLDLVRSEFGTEVDVFSQPKEQSASDLLRGSSSSNRHN